MRGEGQGSEEGRGNSEEGPPFRHDGGCDSSPLWGSRDGRGTYPLPPPVVTVCTGGNLAATGGGGYSIHLISKGELTLPLWNPLCGKPGLSVPLGGRGPGAQWAPPRTDRGGSRDRSPLKKLYFLQKKSPSHARVVAVFAKAGAWEGAGGGGPFRCAAGETVPSEAAEGGLAASKRGRE